MNVYKNRHMAGGMMALLSCLLLFSCNSEDFLEGNNGGLFEEYSDHICFGVSPDGTTQTRAQADGGKDEYTAGQFVLRSTDSADTLCVRTIVSDGIHSSADQQMVTRAAPVTKDEFYDQFHVVAYWWKSGELADAFYMDADVTKNGDNIWSSADTYFWPGVGHTLRFYAWAPKDVGFVALPHIYEGTYLNYLDYTVPENVAEQQDIVVANTDEIEGVHNAAVPLTFSHIFTAVRFEVGSQIQAGTIKSVALNGVLSKGVYDFTKGWSLNAEATDEFTDDFTQELNHTITGSETAGSEITDASQTFMMLPQTLPDGATVEVVFADASGTNRTLSASIAGMEWPQGQTVTYRISITPEYDTSEYDFSLFDIRFLDAHYEIYKTNLIVKNVPAGTKWTITASDDATIQAQSDMNSFAQQGYWTDNNVNESGDVTSSARGYASYSGTGSGTFPIAIFVPENTGEEMRTVKLTVRVGSNEVKPIEFYQLAPSWYGTGIGCERFEEEQQPWGFYWSNDYKLSFDLTACDRDSRESIRQYVEWTQALHESQDESFISSLLQSMFGDDIPDLGFVDMDKSDGDIADKITIDLGSIYEAGTGANIAQSRTDGKSNTREMYNFKGIPFVNELINTLQSMDAVRTEGSGTFPTNNAAIACMKLNSWDIVTVSDEEMLKLTNEDGNPDWYLPASDEIRGIQDDFYPLNGNYWTSTSVAGSHENAFKYDASGAIGSITEERRDSQLNVRAVRKKP